jgi:hypothetical protein
MNIHKNKRQRKGLSLTFKQGTRQDYVIQKHNNHEQEHEMCKTNMIFVMLAYANMNMKRTWQGYGARSCLRLMLNILKEMRGPISIYTPLGT